MPMVVRAFTPSLRTPISTRCFGPQTHSDQNAVLTNGIQEGEEDLKFQVSNTRGGNKFHPIRTAHQVLSLGPQIRLRGRDVWVIPSLTRYLVALTVSKPHFCVKLCGPRQLQLFRHSTTIQSIPRGDVVLVLLRPNL